MSMQAPGVQDKGDKEGASAASVNKFHNKSDVDVNRNSQHHTIGTRATQASGGDHIHDGRASKQLLAGTAIIGSRSGGGALDSVLQALVKLGATDSTTA